MGPTNVALVKLFRADQAMREAQERLDAAGKNVRIQERRVHDLAEKLRLCQTTLKEATSKGKQLELELATRDAHIEKLRTQQQGTHNNKEYQAYSVEISTQKVDRGKSEELSIKQLEVIDKAQTEVNDLVKQLESEQAKLAAMKAESGATLAIHQAEVESLRPAREEAASTLSPHIREVFERLADHHEGEAMAALAKPDRRREEYLCMACHMELARDVYNKLHTRDEIIYCPSCRRILYIPDDLPREAAIKSVPKVRTVVRKAKSPRTKKSVAAAAADAEASGESSAAEVVIEPRAKGRLGDVLAKAQGYTVSRAAAAGHKPVECEVLIDGTLAGIYKGQSPDALANAVRFHLQEAGLSGDVEVKAVPEEKPEIANTPAPVPAAETQAPAAAVADQTAVAAAAETGEPVPTQS